MAAFCVKRADLNLLLENVAVPIYEYQCQSCSHQMEALQKMADASLTDCPACGESELIKLVSAPSFKLTGTGWYETDFKNSKKDEAKSTSGSGDSASGSSESSASKSDTGGATEKTKVSADSPKKTSSSTGSASAAD